MSIAIVKVRPDGGREPMTLGRKLNRTYTDGYISPNGDIVENYTVSYVPQDGDTNVTVTFPPKQGTNDTFEILFESEDHSYCRF